MCVCVCARARACVCVMFSKSPHTEVSADGVKCWGNWLVYDDMLWRGENSVTFEDLVMQTVHKIIKFFE